MLAYVARNYKDLQAQEYDKQGFSRRVKTLARCIDKIFEILPPNRIELPSSEELSDAAIYLQSFVINVFGSVDNLAWIWVREMSLVRHDGSRIPDSWIGLRQNNKLVRGSFSLEFQEYLKSLNV